MRARNWSGSRQLRRNSTKPNGSEAAKSRRSSGLSCSPAQPRTIARGARGVLVGKAAPDLLLFQIGAEPFRCCRIVENLRLDAVPDAFVAEIGADRDGRQLAQRIRMLPFQPGPLILGRFRTAQCAELDPYRPGEDALCRRGRGRLLGGRF